MTLPQVFYFILNLHEFFSVFIQIQSQTNLVVKIDRLFPFTGYYGDIYNLPPSYSKATQNSWAKTSLGSLR